MFCLHRGQTGYDALRLRNFPVLGCGYIEAITNTTQQSGQTPDQEVHYKSKTLLSVSAVTLKRQTAGGDNIPVVSVSM